MTDGIRQLRNQPLMLNRQEPSDRRSRRGGRWLLLLAWVLFGWTPVQVMAVEQTDQETVQPVTTTPNAKKTREPKTRAKTKETQPASKKAKEPGTKPKSASPVSKKTKAPEIEVTTGEAAFKRLQGFLNRLKTVEADFKQQVENPDTPDRATSSGHFLAAKPARFRWDYTLPHQQTVVSDGSVVWYYEPDLKQATRTSAGRLGDSPAAFLIAGGNLEHSFTWQATKDPQLNAWAVQLTPKKEGSIQELTITLHPSKEDILALQVVDALGHRSRFTFESLRINSVINQTVNEMSFRFQPPPGVDIIDEERGGK